MASLEEIQAKFDFCQQELANGFYKHVDESFLVHFSGVLLKYCKLNCPFEVWYDNVFGFPVLGLLNDMLIERGKFPFTKEEMKLYYNHVFQNVLKESIK